MATAEFNMDNIPNHHHHSGSSSPPSEPFDLVCVGLGPAQLSIAIALEEGRGGNTRSLFLERQNHLEWYPNVCLPGSRMQDPFMLDLATPRNPRSKFSFASYLHAHERLAEFANLGQLRPLREEFHDYLQWCAAHLDESASLQFGVEVTDIQPVRQGRIAAHAWDIRVRETATGREFRVQAKHVVLPRRRMIMQAHIDFPAQLMHAAVVIPSSQYLAARDDLFATILDDKHGSRPLNVAIVGTNLQALETVADIASNQALGNITFFTQDWAMKAQGRQEHDTQVPKEHVDPLCSLWVRNNVNTNDNSCSTGVASDELLRTIFARGYEKHLASQGKYGLDVITESRFASRVDTDYTSDDNQFDIVINDLAAHSSADRNLLSGLDHLILKARPAGRSVQELLFKRTEVVANRTVWLVSADAESNSSAPGCSISADMALRAGEIAAVVAQTAAEEEDKIFISPAM